MKILVLQAYYTPEFAASLYLTENTFEKFAKEGNFVEIYCPQPTRGIDEKTRSKYKKIKTEILCDGNLVIHRFNMIGEGKNPLLRAYRYFLCSLKYIWYGAKCRNVNLIFVSSTPPIQGAIGAIVKKIIHKPLVYNLQDIFPDSLVGTGLTHEGSLLWKVGRVIENFSYRNADRIIVISEDFKKNIIRKKVSDSKIRVIYNWVDENAVTNVRKEENYLFDIYSIPRDKFYVSYCGNIGLTQNIDMLLEVADNLKEYKDIGFILVGEGAYKERAKKIIFERQLDNVIMIPFQSYSDISKVFSLGDVGLIISKPGVGKNSVPSKTWSIMSAERPVIANFDENQLKSIILDNECGMFTKAGDKENFIDAVLSLYNNRKLCIQMGKNGRNFVIQNLTKEIGTNKCLDVINELK